MSIIQQLKVKAGKHYLKKELQANTRTIKSRGLNEVKQIGILFLANDRETYNLVEQYADVFRELKKNVKIVGYIPSRKVSQEYYQKLDLDIFDWNNTNWYLSPNRPKLNDFQELELDLLISLVREECIPLEFVIARSKAAFKVGAFSDSKKELFDLMIHSTPEEDLKTFMKNIFQYLDMLSS
ncbi:MAG: hypothetical protein V2A54_18015 [Bacteroidota bacterium]